MISDDVVGFSGMVIQKPIRDDMLCDECDFYQLSYDFGYLLGAVLGDGSLRRKKGVSRDSLNIIFCLKDKDFMDAIARAYFNVTNTIMRYKLSESSHMYHGYMGDRVLWKQIDSYRSNNWSILDLPIDVKCGFVSGFFDAEGCVCGSDRFLSIVNTNFKLLRIVQMILSSFDITTGTSQPSIDVLRKRNINALHVGVIYIYGVRRIRIFNSVFTSCIERKRVIIGKILSNRDILYHCRVGSKAHTWVNFISTM